ncbi:MAG TPA: endo-1,4-beta-xylanase [Phycisphaerales bacterium]|nr:endo-1,4-beta-xylanase [Phycisphaerales bacterium]
MLSFMVFDEAGQAQSPMLRRAYLLGKDDLAIPAQIHVDDGCIKASKDGRTSAALALQVDAGASGRLTLQTCLLPDRDRTYLLELELARHRIMLFLNKLEEWSMSDLPADHPAMSTFEKARGLFSKALCAERGSDGAYTRKQADLAREALQLAIDASEKLAALNAERELAARLRIAEPPPKIEPGKHPSASASAHATFPLIGCTVHNDLYTEGLHRVLTKSFDFINCPMRWSELEREEGSYNFAHTDRWIEWAVRQAKLPVFGGPVLDLSESALPEWLYIWENDYRTLRELAYEHLKLVVTRYRRTVSRWTIISGVNVNSPLRLSAEHMIDLTRLAVLLVRKLHPAAKVIVEIAQPFGEHATANAASVPPLLYSELVNDSGTQPDGFGLRFETGHPEVGGAARDLMQLSALLDAFSVFDRPLHVTALGAPSQPVTAEDAMGATGDPGDSTGPLAEPALREDPGYWRKPWSPASQAEWLTHAIAIAASKSFVQSICWQGLVDVPIADVPHGGLLTAEGQHKPALKRFADIVAAIRSRKWPAALPPIEG